MGEIRAGTASLDLVKKIIKEEGSQTEKRFGPKEIVDQVATFFFAGQETIASDLARPLYICWRFILNGKIV